MADRRRGLPCGRRHRRVVGGGGLVLLGPGADAAASRRRGRCCPQLAAREIPEVFAYDYQTVERSLADAYPLLTPDYRQEFQKSANAQIIPEAKKREVVVQANVVGVGVMSAKRDSASVMVYLNRTVTDKSRQPLYDGSRLRVDFKKIGDKWLIAYITPI